MLDCPIADTFDDEDKIPSPALLVFPELVKCNISKTIEIVGNPCRLRPHVKTHKVPQIVRMHLDAGIDKFKCSTLSEVMMVAEAGANDILLAYPLTGSAFPALSSLLQRWPAKTISVLVDNLASAKQLDSLARTNNLELPVFVDIDNGMERTGIKPDDEAFGLYTYLEESQHLKAAGLHVYDGHIHDNDLDKREASCSKDFESVLRLKEKLESDNFAINEMVCGGTPTFPLHAEFPDRILSPGTYTLWDYGYSDSFPDLEFSHAAWLLTRVVSKPGTKKLCLDLGHKAVASEMNQPRVRFAEIENYTVSCHSEEHLVIVTELADSFLVGDVLHGVPTHICPTVALHDQFYVIENNRLKTTWPIIARNRGMNPPVASSSVP
ncbi:MAG: D-TA family PLP-dependent enzyme [Planctomycetota bacterium]|jgi:D-serine deaminase-like pyridoxal phosphate-dependent protein